MVCILHIEFRHKRIPPQPHNASNNVIYFHVLLRIILAQDPIVNTVASRARQVKDELPFSRFVAFGNDAETAHMKNREGRLREGASHPARLDFGLQIIVNDLRVLECRSHVPRCRLQGSTVVEAKVKTLAKALYAAFSGLG